MNQYEGMIIFSESLDEDALDTAVGSVKAEVEKLGGQVGSVTRLGKRGFARTMNKRRGGHYVVFALHMDGAQVAVLHERFKLMPDVFRTQILRAETVPTAAGDKGQEKRKGDEDGDT